MVSSDLYLCRKGSQQIIVRVEFRMTMKDQMDNKSIIMTHERDRVTQTLEYAQNQF